MEKIRIRDGKNRIRDQHWFRIRKYFLRMRARGIRKPDFMDPKPFVAI